MDDKKEKAMDAGTAFGGKQDFSTLMSIERGKQHMNKDQLQFICEIYNVKKSDLIAKPKP
ncbi:hypothetical protein MHB63_11735 [Bacillus sp. FSL H8-0547]